MTDGPDTPDVDRPWWASDADGLDPDEDPVDRHRSARDAADDPPGRGPGAAGRERPDLGSPFADAIDAFGRAAREVAGAYGASGAHGHRHRPDGDTEVCRLCPICALLRALQDSRPEVVAHLSDAAHHLTLAARAVLDAHAEGTARGGVEHIPVDDA